MKQKLLYLLATAFLFAACNNEKKDDNKTDNRSDTTKKTTDFIMPDSATMMKNWQDYMTKGEMHAMMASWDGTWTSEVSSYEKPGAPPTTSTGTTVNKMVMNGMYQESIHSGTMMGMPFEGKGMLAYDNAKKKFVNTWIDNMGSGIMVMEGPWDPATKTMTLTGNCYNPAMGKDCNLREVFKVIDDNNQVMEMYGPGPDGKETKMMEIKFTRKS
jgi:hypothetical protein